MKLYINPKIRRIKLDPNQSMLQVCSIGGIWFNIPVGNYCMISGGTVTDVLMFSTCTQSVRGVTNPTNTMAANPSEYPS
ncbi:MAG: hypothetical protein PHQ52_07515 [Candidatus Omnitrophica bacterium]|nr:hypothetical protein [Candidatus Omnitrophota bacterium]